MRIVFAGFGELGATVLGALHEQHEVSLVLTHRDGFSALRGDDVEQLALKYEIPLFLSSRADEPELLALLGELSADALVSTNWRTRLPGTVLSTARLGALNVHDALLPEYAGFGAVNWAIRDGRDQTGLTVHVMDEELDTGPILLQTRVDIGPEDTATAVYTRLLAQYGPAALEALRLLEAGVTPRPQDPTAGSFGHRISAEDNAIDWTASTRQIVDLVRSQSAPFLNAWCLDGDRRLYVRRARSPVRSVRGNPGRVVAGTHDGVLVACGKAGDPLSRGVLLTHVSIDDGGEEIPATSYFDPVRGVRFLR